MAGAGLLSVLVVEPDEVEDESPEDDEELALEDVVEPDEPDVRLSVR